MKPNHRLLRALTTAFSSAAAAKPKPTAKTPKKSWKIFTADPPPPPSIKSQPPKTIRLTDDICNSASFVGTITGPVQRVDVPGVGVGASASLLVKDSSGKDGSFEILLKMQDKMAEMCLEHIKQNDLLHVSGRVKSFARTDENEKSQTCCEVSVKEINYVTESEHIPIEESVAQLDLGESEYSPIDKSVGQLEASPTANNAGQSNSGGVSGFEKHSARIRLFRDLFANPSKWYDNRTSKRTPNQPDFKHKDSGEALWINYYDPPWLKEQLQQLDSKLLAAQDQKPPIGEDGLEKHRARLRLLQMLFTNPSEWHDRRNKKVKPNHPDFKHKDTGEAIWLDPRDPPWVKIQLEQLDSKLAEQERKTEDSNSSFSISV